MFVGFMSHDLADIIGLMLQDYLVNEVFVQWLGQVVIEPRR